MGGLAVNVEDLVKRAVRDDELRELVCRLGLAARDNGMKSKDYTRLIKLFAETPADLRALKSTDAYANVVEWAASNFTMRALSLPVSLPPSFTARPPQSNLALERPGRVASSVSGSSAAKARASSRRGKAS